MRCLIEAKAFDAFVSTLDAIAGGDCIFRCKQDGAIDKVWSAQLWRVLTGCETSIFVVGVTVVTEFSCQGVINTVTAFRQGTIDIAFSGHFRNVAIFGKFHHAVAAGGLRINADSEIERACVAIWTVCVALTVEPAVFWKLKGKLAGAQEKTGQCDEQESLP